MAKYDVKHFQGGISEFEDRGIKGSFKYAENLDIHGDNDSIKAGQALRDIGLLASSASQSPSASRSPSTSLSPSFSPSISPSASVSPSVVISPSSSRSPSASSSPSSSASVSASVSPSSSVSLSLSPSAGLTTVFADLIRWWVKASDGNLYGAGNTGKIYKITNEFVVTLVHDLHQSITGFGEKPSLSGKTYLLIATRTELHIKDLFGQADWNDVDKVPNWPKNNLDAADWHTMAQINGAMQIANKNKLALVGYDDSYTNEALDMIPGNIAKTLVERDGRVIVGTYRLTDPDKGVNGAIDSEVPLAQVGNDGEIFYTDMVQSQPVKRIFGGGKVNPGGVCNAIDQVNFFEWEDIAISWIDKQSVGNMALFGFYNNSLGRNGVYSYGRKQNNKPMVLNNDYALDVDEIGAVCSFNGIVAVSYRDYAGFGVKITDTERKAIGLYQGIDLNAPVKDAEEVTPWTHVELWLEPLPAGTSIEFYYKVDKTGEFIKAKTADGEEAFTGVNGQRAVFRISAHGEVFEPRVMTYPHGNDTPEIRRIRPFFVGK